MGWESPYISVSERITRPMPRITRVISSELIMARSGHATHDAERARKGGENCDKDFEQGCPVELVHDCLGFRVLGSFLSTTDYTDYSDFYWE